MEHDYFPADLIRTAANVIETLLDAADEHTLQLTADLGSDESIQWLMNDKNKHAAKLKAKKKSVKSPRKSKSGNPAKRAEAEKKRQSALDEKATLKGEISAMSGEIKRLSDIQATAERINNGETVNVGKDAVIDDFVYQFTQALRRMCKASYQSQADGSNALPSYLDVYDAMAIAFTVLPHECNASWLRAVEAFNQHQYGEELVKMALAYMAVSKRATQHPHNLGRWQVFDGIGDSEWEKAMKAYVETNIIEKQRDNAIRCTQLTYDYTEIQHVSTVIDTAMPSIRTDGEAGICNVFLSAPMGGVYNAEVNGHVHNSGSKTDGVLLPAIQAGLDNGQYITVIVHRITLIENIFARVNAFINRHSPSHEGKVWDYRTPAFGNPRVLVVCVNSITKQLIAEFVKRSKVVIVDEFAQVLDNIFGLMESGGDKDRVLEPLPTFNLLADVMADKSTTFIALDADMESRTIELIKQYTGTVGCTGTFKITHPECLLPNHERSKQIIFHRSGKNQKQLAAQLGKQGDKRLLAEQAHCETERFFVATDSKNLSTAINDSLKPRGLFTCLINADTTGDQDVRELIDGKRPPEYSSAVIYSPSITSGVSWTSPNFTRGIVVGNGVIPASYLKQMMFRFRKTNIVHVFGGLSPNMEKAPVDPEQERKITLAAANHSHGALYMAVRAHRRELADESTKNQLKCFAYQAEAEGWGIFTVDPTALPNSEDESDSGVVIDRSYRTNAVMNSQKITLQEYKQLIDRNSTRSTEDTYAAERFNAAVYGAVSDSDANTRLWLSCATGASVGAIQAHLLSSTETLTRNAVDALMTSAGFPDWWELATQGEDIELTSKVGTEFLLASLNNPAQLNALHVLGAFDSGLESSRKKWTRTHGAPIKENAAVISQSKAAAIAKARGFNPGPLIEGISRKLPAPYEAYQLIDGNVLVVNTKPKDGSWGGTLIRRLLNQCGIPVSSNRGINTVDGEKAAALIAMAKRKAIAQRIQSEISAAPLFGTVTRKCWTDASGFEVTVRRDGTVEITATADVLARVTDEEQLTRAGWCMDAEFGNTKRNYPLSTGGNRRKCSQIGATKVNKVVFVHEDQQTKGSGQSIADVFDLLLPVLLADSGVVEAMLAEMKISHSLPKSAMNHTPVLVN
ncbi:hypothetical protein L4C36_20735 [Photobacterium japonica]|uniref:hypothetical protein n=1 Tax=Photobacterium japonica TaxID=2910235 RepID=UPI003D0B5F73